MGFRLHQAAAIRLLGKHLPIGLPRRKALQAVTGILLRDETAVETTEALLVLIARAAEDEHAGSFASWYPNLKGDWRRASQSQVCRPSGKRSAKKLRKRSFDGSA